MHSYIHISRVEHKEDTDCKLGLKVGGYGASSWLQRPKQVPFIDFRIQSVYYCSTSEPKVGKIFFLEFRVWGLGLREPQGKPQSYGVNAKL